MFGIEQGDYDSIAEKELARLDDDATRQRITRGSAPPFSARMWDATFSGIIKSVITAPVMAPLTGLLYWLLRSQTSMGWLFALAIAFGVAGLLTDLVIPVKHCFRWRAAEYRRMIRQRAREEGFAVCAACGYFGGGRIEPGEVRCSECGTATKVIENPN